MSHPPVSTLTPQQERAVITRDVSVVLSSGAGCGKTHVLTERYLSHLREGAEVGPVVAVTLTARAARRRRKAPPHPPNRRHPAPPKPHRRRGRRLGPTPARPGKRPHQHHPLL